MGKEFLQNKMNFERAETQQPQIFNRQSDGERISFHLKKVSRKRYIKLIMALGVPAREAQLKAKAAHAAGISYKEALDPTMRAIYGATENTLFKFWIYIWWIKGLK